MFDVFFAVCKITANKFLRTTTAACLAKSKFGNKRMQMSLARKSGTGASQQTNAKLSAIMIIRICLAALARSSWEKAWYVFHCVFYQVLQVKAILTFSLQLRLNVKLSIYWTSLTSFLSGLSFKCTSLNIGKIAKFSYLFFFYDK